jgi:hypothetical protein
MTNPSRPDFLIEVNGRRGFNPIERGTNLIYRWFKGKRRHWNWGALPRNKEET